MRCCCFAVSLLLHCCPLDCNFTQALSAIAFGLQLVWSLALLGKVAILGKIVFLGGITLFREDAVLGKLDLCIEAALCSKIAFLGKIAVLVLSHLDMYHTKVLLYHTMVLMARLTKVRR